MRLFVLACLLLGVVILVSELGRGQPLQPVCGDERMQEEMRQIMYDALDAALQQHIGQLFVVITKEVQTVGKVDRAAAGMQLGITSYVRGRQLVANWRLPVC